MWQALGRMEAVERHLSISRCLRIRNWFIGESISIRNIESKNKEETADNGKFTRIIVANYGDPPCIFVERLCFDDGELFFVDAAGKVGMMLNLIA